MGDVGKRGNVTLVEVGSRPSYLIYEHSLMVEQRSPKSLAWVRFLLFVFPWLLTLVLSYGKLVVS